MSYDFSSRPPTDAGRSFLTLELGDLGQNNFDLIRLFAASQVAVLHIIGHLQLPGSLFNALAWILAYVPGVPVFFLVSGFLISRSYLRSPSWLEYSWNRLLRLYPALVVCFVLSVALVWATGYLRQAAPSWESFGVWALAQLTILQVYNPDFMREFGVGVLNGSLWTIPVEMQFYIMLPLLFALTRLRQVPLMVVTLVFMGLYTLHAIAVLPNAVWRSLLGVTFIPWIGLFLLGVMASLHWERLKPWVVGRFWTWLLIYVGMHVATAYLLPGYGRLGNGLSVIFVIGLAGLVLSAAYTASDLSDRILRRNDISYGIYIYHMPIVNVLIYLGFTGSSLAGVIGFFGVVILASLSWALIEKPTLRLKTGFLIRR